MFAAILAAIVTLTGCAGERDAFDSPIDLYHGLQGGTIASQRPPPPGVGDPYPNLDSVPAKPTPTSAAQRTAIYAALASERDRVQRQDRRDPLTTGLPAVPPSPSAPGGPESKVPAPAAPAAPAPATPAPATPAAATPAAPAPAATPAASTADSAPSVAVLQAAEAPPPKPPARVIPPRAPLGPLPALEAQALTSSPLPDIPAQPPAPPALEGEAAPPGPPGSVNVYFRLGSAVVPLDADAALRQLAAERKNQPIAVVAPGDVPIPRAGARRSGAEAAGLALGLQRAQAIATVLAEAGVPASALSVVARGAGIVDGRAGTGVARVVGRD